MNSMRARLTAAFATAFALLVLAGNVAFIGYMRVTAQRDADALLRASLLRFRSEVAPNASRASALAELGEEREELHANGVVAILIAPDGRIVMQTERNAPDWPVIGNNWRARSTQTGNDTLILAVPWGGVEKSLRRAAVALAALSALALIFAAGAAWWLIGRTLSPIRALSRQATSASTDTLRVSLTAPSNDAELVELVETLNGMLGRLADVSESRGRFYAAASHELRTPLQALQGHLELALSRDRDPAEYRTALNEAREQTERLTKLVRDLLMLNRLHSAPSPPEIEFVNLAEICARTLAMLRPAVTARHLRINADLDDRFELRAAPTYVEMLLRNLLENAVKYTPAGGAVAVTIVTGSPTRIDIRNDCGLGESVDAAKLFDPFYRPDASRTSDTGGNGLGLAICKAICDASGWTISITQAPSTFLVSVSFHRSSSSSN